MKKSWVTEGFEDFRKGTFGNGGQNIYVSRAGVLQRIYQYDLNHNGYFDLVFANCQNHHEAVPSYIYKLDGTKEELPAQGALSGTAVDLTGNGYKDIIVSGYYDMAAPFASTDIYYGSAEGYSEKRHIKIPTPFTEDCCYGNFNGSGKTALVFAMPLYKTVRIFYQTELGIEWDRYIDLPIDAALITAADLDGDGYDELIVRRKSDDTVVTVAGSSSAMELTSATVYWGGPEGIKIENRTEFPELSPSEVLQPEDEKTMQSNMEKKFKTPRLLKKVVWNGKECFTVSSGKKIYFIGAGKNRNLERVLELEVPLAIAVAAGDINGDGYDDIAVASRVRNPDDIHKQCSYIYWGGPKGFSQTNRTVIDTQQACDVEIQKFSSEKYCDVLFCQSSVGHAYTNNAILYIGCDEGIKGKAFTFRSEDSRRAFMVKNPYMEPLVLILNHYSRSSVGFDKTYVYYGGKDGYSPERREEVPCWCAVDSLSCDLNDDGWAELVVCNNSENSLHLDPGSHVHHFGPKGFEPEKSYLLPTKMGWGGFCADFNHNGYLDLVFVYNHYKDLIIFHGSENGFKKSTIIELKKEDGTPYGSPRWIGGADLNKNGYIDLIIPLIDSERTLILWGSEKGFSIERKTELAVFHGACARVADLTKNGYPDLIIGTHTETPKLGELTSHNPHHSFVHIYWNGPEGLKENNKTVLRADACDALCVADFNNNGWLDIFACSYHGGKDRDINSFLYWNREGRFHELDRQLIFTHSASGAIAADFNEDGYIDLAVANHKVWGDHKGFSSVWWNGPNGFDIKKRTDLPTCGPHGMTVVEPGNQLDRGPEEYYISVPYKLPENAQVKSISWEGEIPPKTWVKAQIRFAETQIGLEFSEWINVNQSITSEIQNGQWVQYKLALGAINSLRSPRLKKVIVAYEV